MPFQEVQSHLAECPPPPTATNLGGIVSVTPQVWNQSVPRRRPSSSFATDAFNANKWPKRALPRGQTVHPPGNKQSRWETGPQGRFLRWNGIWRLGRRPHTQGTSLFFLRRLSGFTVRPNQQHPYRIRLFTRRRRAPGQLWQHLALPASTHRGSATTSHSSSTIHFRHRHQVGRKPFLNNVINVPFQPKPASKIPQLLTLSGGQSIT